MSDDWDYSRGHHPNSPAARDAARVKAAEDRLLELEANVTRAIDMSVSIDEELHRRINILRNYQAMISAATVAIIVYLTVDPQYEPWAMVGGVICVAVYSWLVRPKL